MTTSGDVGTEIAPEVADDPQLAARLNDLLHRACSLARALTGAEQPALSVDLHGDGHGTRKLFNLSAHRACCAVPRRQPPLLIYGFAHVTQTEIAYARALLTHAAVLDGDLQRADS